jgi:hypothetical protein
MAMIGKRRSARAYAALLPDAKFIAAGALSAARTAGRLPQSRVRFPRPTQGHTMIQKADIGF